MADVIISRGRHRAFAIPETDKGKKHLFDNYVCGNQNYLAFDVEHIEDMIKDLEAAELIVDVK